MTSKLLLYQWTNNFLRSTLRETRGRVLELGELLLHLEPRAARVGASGELARWPRAEMASEKWPGGHVLADSEENPLHAE